MCAFNPVYGQGMTHALRHARELNKIFEEHRHKLEDISYIFNRRASVISKECWLASITNDWKTPTLKVIETDKNGKIETYQRGVDSDTMKCSEPRKRWIKDPKYACFLQECKAGPYLAHCSICKSDFLIANGGTYLINRYLHQTDHKRLVEIQAKEQCKAYDRYTKT
ncbi:unnamed protein product [Rotaria sp. Silwood2]|nr:unnamed protein product [Rotaria sp. Silwood2]CAF4073712.1 unnamed protein product [Rotaria sp. Silwood2]